MRKARIVIRQLLISSDPSSYFFSLTDHVQEQEIKREGRREGDVVGSLP
jgi:hypothetical protein